MTKDPPVFGDPLELVPSPEVLAFLARRRSLSAVTLAEPAPNAGQLRELLSLATRVPDHGKLAPWRFIILEGDGKTRFSQALEDLAAGRGDQTAVAKLAKLKTPPLVIAVISSPKPNAIPEWEQLLSAGAVCTNLLYGALSMGFGANWITDWYAYDAEATALLGLSSSERVAGFIMLGSARQTPLERERPALDGLVTHWA